MARHRATRVDGVVCDTEADAMVSARSPLLPNIRTAGDPPEVEITDFVYPWRTLRRLEIVARPVGRFLICKRSRSRPTCRRGGPLDLREGVRSSTATTVVEAFHKMRHPEPWNRTPGRSPRMWPASPSMTARVALDGTPGSGSRRPTRGCRTRAIEQLGSSIRCGRPTVTELAVYWLCCAGP